MIPYRAAAIPRHTLTVVARQRFSSMSPRRPLLLASAVHERSASHSRHFEKKHNFGGFVLTMCRRPIHMTAIKLSGMIDVEGPAFAESITEGDIRWIKQKGDMVAEDELVAEIETDKTSVEVNAPQAGTIVELLVADGSKVTAKQKLYRLLPGAAPAGAPKEEKTAAAPPPPKPSPSPPKPSPADSPAAPAKAAPPPPPSPPRSSVGPIPTSKPPVGKPPSGPISSTPTTQIGITRVRVPEGVSPDQAITGSREEIRVKMNRMRQRISQRLKDAQNTYAMLTTFNEVDMSNVMEMRTRYQKEFQKKHGIKLGLMSPFVRAAAYALTEQPVINAVIDEGEIVYRRFVDLSIAVATPKGLVVPVLRNVETLDYAGIELELAALGEKARDNKLAVEDMEGGTFTISNGGVFGSLFGTPIINPPQSAILGMHGIFDKPVAVNGKVEIRPIMVVALTYDHRLVDGREAVTFLRKIKQAVEDPRVILMNL